MTQMKHREKLLGSAASAGGGKKGGHVAYASEDDMHLFIGTSTTRGRLCISPKLMEHVASKQGAEASLYKERRKLMEERRLLKNAHAKTEAEG